MKKKINLFILLVLFFTGIFFLINTYFFSADLIDSSEEKYIEETLESSKEKIDYLKIAKKIIENNNIKEENNTFPTTSLEKDNEYILKEENKINFGFVPDSFKKHQKINKEEISTILKNEKINSFLEEINVIFYEKKGDVRGRMKNKSVKLFAPQEMKEDELIAIFIHELSHYIDIYFLEKKEYNDISNKFYGISWNSTKIMNSGMKSKDFVSGYSMTNKYEDFSESLTYYILHNKDFLEKTKSSKVLKEKYNFFKFYIFEGFLFKDTDFSKGNIIKDYYRDITKINFSLENFLQYLKKSI